MAAGNKSSKPAKKEKAGMLEGLWIVGKYPYVQGITCVSCIFMIEVTILDYAMKVAPPPVHIRWRLEARRLVCGAAEAPAPRRHFLFPGGLPPKA